MDLDVDVFGPLIQRGIIKKEDIAVIRAEAETAGLTVEQALIKRGVTPKDILQAKGDFFDVPTISLEGVDIPGKVLEYIPEDSASHYQMIPISVDGGVLEVGMVNPDNIEARDALNFISSKVSLPLKIYLISDSDFAKVLSQYKGLSGEVTKALSELETELKTSPLGAEDKADTSVAVGGSQSSGGQLSEDAPVTKIVATILRYATDGSASDIHIEPWRESVKVRFRVDGLMNTSIVLPFKVHSAVVARIKILCNMRLDEKRKPQDGRFTARIEGRKIDFRVSTFPTYFGEKVVMRLLDQEKGVKKLDDIILNKRNIDLVRNALGRPYGLILISGPTGSGKTTTLYSMLNEIDRDHQNVLSLEDPVEYNIEGISQSQVQPEIGYTFATGLRTTLRQDPDVIMVGEIRDKETAQLAIQAALTGHLVFSTIHTNSAIGVVPRLVDMGVDPYLIAPTLILSMAQRLNLGLCPEGGNPVKVEGAIKMMIDKQFQDLPKKYLDQLELTDTVYEKLSSPDCPNGTRGRVPAIEVLEIDKEVQSIILKNPTEIEIGTYARSQGMLTMKEDAILQAMHRRIPFEEVYNL